MKRSYLFILLLQGVENLLLVTPLIYTFANVKERHQFLEDTIGPVPLEIEAMERLRWLTIFAPLLVVLSIPAQFLVIWLFNKYGHPWARFFNEFSNYLVHNTTDERNMDELPMLSKDDGAQNMLLASNRFSSTPCLPWICSDVTESHTIMSTKHPNNLKQRSISLPNMLDNI